LQFFLGAKGPLRQISQINIAVFGKAFRLVRAEGSNKLMSYFLIKGMIFIWRLIIFNLYFNFSLLKAFIQRLFYSINKKMANGWVDKVLNGGPSIRLSDIEKLF
jgi:hypothetical protein